MSIGPSILFIYFCKNCDTAGSERMPATTKTPSSTYVKLLPSVCSRAVRKTSRGRATRFAMKEIAATDDCLCPRHLSSVSFNLPSFSSSLFTFAHISYFLYIWRTVLTSGKVIALPRQRLAQVEHPTTQLYGRATLGPSGVQSKTSLPQFIHMPHLTHFSRSIVGNQSIFFSGISS